MKNNKWVSIVVIVLIVSIIGCLTACGGPKGAAGSGNSNGGTTKPDNNSVADLGRDFSATIEETVLVDEAGVKITAKSLSYSDYSAELDLQLENNSDRDLSFYAGTMGCSMNSINGYMIPDGYVGEDIAAGMMANVKMSYNLDQLSIYGIKDIADIGLGFQIKDENDDYLVTGPMEIKTSIADSYDYSKETYKEAMDSNILKALGGSVDYRAEDVLYDEQGIKILSEYVVTNKDGEQSLFLEVQNSSDQNMNISATDAAINGITCASTAESEYIVAGKKCVMSITLDNLLDRSYLEKLGMKEYKNFLCYFGVSDENYDALGGKDIEIVFDGEVKPEDIKGEIVYDANGFKVMNLGIVKDSFELSDDLHILLLVKNDTDQIVTISDGFNDVYVNKTKISTITLGQDARPGSYALIDFGLMGYDLEDNSIDISAITEANVKLEMRDSDYQTLDEPEIALSY